MWQQDMAFNCSSNHEKAKYKLKQISILWITILVGSIAHIHMEHYTVLHCSETKLDITLNDRPQNHLYRGTILNADVRPINSASTSL
jgi:hypothetical protein